MLIRRGIATAKHVRSFAFLVVYIVCKLDNGSRI